MTQFPPTVTSRGRDSAQLGALINEREGMGAAVGLLGRRIDNGLHF